MKNSVLVRNGQHMRPMLSVLKRYGIGAADKYGRGLWISKNDLPEIWERMNTDETRGTIQGVVFVSGTNMHNSVLLRDFEELFS